MATFDGNNTSFQEEDLLIGETTFTELCELIHQADEAQNDLNIALTEIQQDQLGHDPVQSVSYENVNTLSTIQDDTSDANNTLSAIQEAANNTHSAIHEDANNTHSAIHEDANNTHSAIPDDTHQLLSKKKFRNEEQWARNVRKRNRNEGNEYTNTSGKKIPKKVLQDRNDCKCKLDCYTRVPFNERLKNHTNFWKLGDLTAQTSYLRGVVKVQDVARKDARDRRERDGNTFIGPKLSKPKGKARNYFVMSNGASVRVCKTFFLETFSISNGRLDRALKLDTTGEVLDGRGKFPAANKTPDEQLAVIKDFILAFPKYESHYRRPNTDTLAAGEQYFAPGLTKTKLYDLYKDHCIKDNREFVTSFVFQDYIKRHFTIKFHSVLKDTCKTCDLLAIKIQTAKQENNTAEVTKLSLEREYHHRKAEAAKISLKADAARTPDGCTVISFDLQKTLPTPSLSTNIVYYKRQLWTYNLGIHNEQNDKASMYMWDEGKASRGPNEIALCLLKHISSSSTAEHLIAYADTCGGQNRNIKIAVFWMFMCQSSDYNINVVDQKFYVSGHSYMSCDRDFSHIEREKSRAGPMYVPNDWFQLVKKFCAKFDVTLMSSEDLKSVENLVKHIVNRNIDIDGNKVEWLKIQWLRFRKETSFKIFYKYSLSENCPFSCVDVSPRLSRRQQRGGLNSVTPFDIDLPQLYPSGRRIAQPKLNDLQTLLDYVPPIQHPTKYINLVQVEGICSVIAKFLVRVVYGFAANGHKTSENFQLPFSQNRLVVGWSTIVLGGPIICNIISCGLLTIIYFFTGLHSLSNYLFE